MTLAYYYSYDFCKPDGTKYNFKDIPFFTDICIQFVTYPFPKSIDLSQQISKGELEILTFLSYTCAHSIEIAIET